MSSRRDAIEALDDPVRESYGQHEPAVWLPPRARRGFTVVYRQHKRPKSESLWRLFAASSVTWTNDSTKTALPLSSHLRLEINLRVDDCVSARVACSFA